jgi:hypothetical protein
MTDTEQIDPSRLVFTAIPKPSLADVEAIPEDSQVIVISWEGQAPEIVGVVFDQIGKHEFTEMFNGQRDVRAGDVFLFYVKPSREENDIVRRAMDLAPDADLALLDTDRPVYSEQDVSEMIRVALRLHATPF